MSTSTPSHAPARYALGMTLTGAVGVALAFVATVVSFAALEAGGTGTKLIGADNELGYPSFAFTLVLFVLVLGVGIAQFAGAQFAVGWWSALTPILIIGVLFGAWSLYLSFTVFALLLLMVMAVALTLSILQVDRSREHTGLGMFLVVSSVIGFFAAFRLTVDKVGTFINPAVAPSCNYSLLVQCEANLKSWQGSLFGFPNPLLGVGGWVAVLLVGIMILAGLRFARWFWIAFNVGLVGALAFVIWLIYQSVFQLHTLCPWCMTTWAVVLPAFWLVTFRNLSQGAIPTSPRARRVFAAVYGMVPLITLLSYVAVAIIAQVGLDVLSYL